jgi:hypothetical protein
MTGVIILERSFANDIHTAFGQTSVAGAEIAKRRSTTPAVKNKNVDRVDFPAFSRQRASKIQMALRRNPNSRSDLKDAETPARFMFLSFQDFDFRMSRIIECY